MVKINLVVVGVVAIAIKEITLRKINMKIGETLTKMKMVKLVLLIKQLVMLPNQHKILIVMVVNEKTHNPSM